MSASFLPYSRINDCCLLLPRVTPLQEVNLRQQCEINTVCVFECNMLKPGVIWWGIRLQTVLGRALRRHLAAGSQPAATAPNVV
jgi:hypothetical protein